MEVVVFATANSSSDDVVNRSQRIIEGATSKFAEIKISHKVTPAVAIFIKEWSDDMYNILKQNFKKVYILSEEKGMSVSRYIITGDRLELEQLYKFYQKTQKLGNWLHYAATFHKDQLIIQEIIYGMDNNWTKLMGDFLR